MRDRFATEVKSSCAAEWFLRIEMFRVGSSREGHIINDETALLCNAWRGSGAADKEARHWSRLPCISVGAEDGQGEGIRVESMDNDSELKRLPRAGAPSFIEKHRAPREMWKGSAIQASRRQGKHGVRARG